MADSKNKYVVVHPKLSMVCGGKPQCPKVGTLLTGLSDAQVKSLGSKIKPYVAAEVVSVDVEEKKK